jgi:hypothetical protein
VRKVKGVTDGIGPISKLSVARVKTRSAACAVDPAVGGAPLRPMSGLIGDVGDIGVRVSRGEEGCVEVGEAGRE